TRYHGGRYRAAGRADRPSAAFHRARSPPPVDCGIHFHPGVPRRRGPGLRPPARRYSIAGAGFSSLFGLTSGGVLPIQTVEPEVAHTVEPAIGAACQDPGI